MYRCVVILMLALLSSCKSEKVAKELPMEQKKVVNILADVHLAEEVSRYYQAKKDSAFQIYMDSIYLIHTIDSNQYNQLIDFLEDNIDVYYKVQQEVHKRLKVVVDEQENAKDANRQR